MVEIWKAGGYELSNNLKLLASWCVLHVASTVLLSAFASSVQQAFVFSKHTIKTLGLALQISEVASASTEPKRLKQLTWDCSRCAVAYTFKWKKQNDTSFVNGGIYFIYMYG